MKKTVSILLSLCFVASLNTGAFAATKTASTATAKKVVVAKAPVKAQELSAKGPVRNFTEKTITVVVNGKDVTYKIAGTTKVIQNDTPVAFLDAVQKGIYVTFKYMNTTNTVTTITIPNAGAYGQGDLKLKLVDINIAQTDSNIGVSAPKVNAGFFVKSESQIREDMKIVEHADGFAYSNDGNMNTWTGDKDAVSLGALEIVPASVTVKLDGKDLKVITGVTCDRNDDGIINKYTKDGKDVELKDIFDSSVIGDEAALIVDAWNLDLSIIKFEKNLYEDEAKYTIEDLESRLQVGYDKKVFKITTFQITEFPLNDDVVCELNGKTASLAKVLNRANYSIVTTNLAGEIVFVNGFYKEMIVKVDKVAGNKLTFSKLAIDTDPKSQVKFTETITVSDGVTVQESTGAPLEMSSLAAGDLIKITTEQEDGYKVTLIEKIVK